ncbi:MAG TPA: YraN family protein [Candidatus Deferrimicrobium sp.]|nr:YraN family protein [Candidatus Deferrimicrobium sp.]
MDARRRLGQDGEKLALEYLVGLGMKLLARNYRCRLGELDLILADKGQIVFVEVRTKTSDSYGSGLESITMRKITKLRVLAMYYLADKHLTQDASIRFDIVAIHKPHLGQVKLEHLKAAF